MSVDQNEYPRSLPHTQAKINIYVFWFIEEKYVGELLDATQMQLLYNFACMHHAPSMPLDDYK